MFESPFMDAVIFTIPGTPLSMNWYGLSFAATFLFGIWYANRRSDRAPGWGVTREMNGDLLIYILTGVIVGARLGYVLFYGLDQLLPVTEVVNSAGQLVTTRGFDFMYIFKIYEGGLSFHGGFLGVCVA